MAGVELLYKPPKRSVLDLRSNLANDLRQQAITRKREEKNRDLDHQFELKKLGSSSSLPTSDRVHSRIKESVYKAKSALASMKVPDLDIEDVRQEYIQKVGRDYSAVGLTSYIIAQKDAKEFRERCFSVLSRRPKAVAQEEQYYNSDSPFFNNRKLNAVRPKTPDEILLSSLGKNDPLAPISSVNRIKYAPSRIQGTYDPFTGSPFSEHGSVSEHNGSITGDGNYEDIALTIGAYRGTDNLEYIPSYSRTPQEREVGAPWPDGSVTRTPEKTPLEVQKNRREVVEDILEENKDRIPQDLDVKALGYAEKRKLLKQLGFEDDYIANRLCEKYTTSKKNRNTKLTPLEAFSMYDRSDLNESIKVHKDLSLEFSRYKRGTESPTVRVGEVSAPKDIYKNIKAMLES